MPAPLPPTDTAGATSSASAPRYHGLDWLRAIAAVAVIGLHAGIAYTVVPFPGLAWPVHDARPSPAVDALTWWIDAWIMPVFFMMGGLLAAQLFRRLGPADFLKHRTRRLLVPFAFACVAILPLDLYAWLLGWVVEERIPLKKLRSLKLGDAGANLWGVGHLWFLEYLFVFCVGAVVVRWLMGAARGGRLRLPAKPLSAVRFPLWPLPLCSALALWADPQLVIGFRHAWHPLPANLLYYAPCFAAGWWMLQRRPDDRRATLLAAAGLLASPLVFAAALPLIHAYAATGLDGSQRVLLAVLFTACGWTAALGALRLSLLPIAAPPPRAVHYVSQASFWLYLFHHPAVGLAQVALHGSGMPAVVKFLLVWLCALALSLLTYAAFVHRTWIGTLLNGRQKPGASSRESPEQTPHVRRAA